MNRSAFLTGLSALAAPALASARIQSDDSDATDPAQNSNAQALRVLLGSGEAQPLDSHTFLFDGRRYRGTFSISPAGVVNTVPLEQYLYSVVSREMPHTWPPAALGTQAVVARTYVLARSTPAREYDLVPSQVNQVYTGIDAEHPQTTAAVDASAGMVLRYGGRFADVMYSSCCGGHTEASSAVWDGPQLRYLQGVACPYCTQSPWYAWTQMIALQTLQHALAKELSNSGDLQNVRLDPPDGSGRARFWNFDCALGTQRIKASQVRASLGSRTLPSTLIRRLALVQQPDRAIAMQGAGLGHGVGLCQWGARGMAIDGADVRAILSFYFPGTASWSL